MHTSNCRHCTKVVDVEESGDRERVTPAILEDLTRRYLELRAPYALGYARAHLDTDSPHVHIVLSANNVDSSKRLRLSSPRFAAIKRDIERQQLAVYPELRHSQAQHLGKKPLPSGAPIRCHPKIPSWWRRKQRLRDLGVLGL